VSERDARDGELSGTLLIDKPRGITSHDVVAMARRALRTRAVGHSGTLDPMATGLLILLVGYATRLSEYVLHLDKEYEATLKFGEQTNTDDAEGEVIATRAVPALELALLRDVSKPFVGDILQVPPQFSAISTSGVRAYTRARAGEHITLAARPVRIDRIEFLTISQPFATLRMTCGSGTYVRALARDIGAALGCGAHLTALRRIRIGPLLAAQATSPAEIAVQQVLPADAAVMHLPACTLDERGMADFLHGRETAMVRDLRNTGAIIDGEPARVYDAGRRFAGIGMLRAHNRVKPEKVFAKS
jgi:tRNA pseudouridine55 synthase